MRWQPVYEKENPLIQFQPEDGLAPSGYLALGTNFAVVTRINLVLSASLIDCLVWHKATSLNHEIRIDFTEVVLLCQALFSEQHSFFFFIELSLDW